jgi:hypothetical protein
MFYNAVVAMGMRPDDFWNLPIGLYLDLWTCHRQYLGWEKPQQYATIDDAIPIGLA